ncbi:MAG: hypothetical protein WC346_18100 [Methanogenium sp.]|jgi:hypothetical protein
MKINKIICDICDKEIDVNNEAGLAMYEHISIQQKLNLMPDVLSKGETNPQTNKEIIKVYFDLCNECALETEAFLIKLREKKINDKGRK